MMNAVGLETPTESRPPQMNAPSSSPHTKDTKPCEKDGGRRWGTAGLSRLAGEGRLFHKLHGLLWKCG